MVPLPTCVYLLINCVYLSNNLIRFDIFSQIRARMLKVTVKSLLKHKVAAGGDCRLSEEEERRVIRVQRSHTELV